MFVTKAKSIKLSRLNRILRYIYSSVEEKRKIVMRKRGEALACCSPRMLRCHSSPTPSSRISPMLPPLKSVCLLSVCVAVSVANKNLLRVYLAPPRAGWGGGKKMWNLRLSILLVHISRCPARSVFALCSPLLTCRWNRSCSYSGGGRHSCHCLSSLPFHPSTSDT